MVELTRIRLEKRTQEAAPMIETIPAFGGLLNLQIDWKAETNEAASAIEKSYDKGAKEKVNRLRVRQFWREKGKA